jgi:mannose-1-phosphate guanylyltransferase
MQEPVALLLAAGLGTRLQPLTHVLPKCLVPVQGYPLLFYWLEQIKVLGIRDCYVNLHYHGDLVRQVIESSPYQGWVKYIEEDELLGTAGTIRAVYPEIQNRSVWLIHADNLSTANWPDFLATYQDKCLAGEMLMHTFETDDPQSCGVVCLDERNRVTEFHEKVKNPPSNLANGAVYLLSAEIVKRIASDPSIFDFSTQVVPELIGKIVAWQTDGYHRDIGRWSSYLAAQQEFSVLWQPGQSIMWLKIWQDGKRVADWVQALEQALHSEEYASPKHLWHVINSWPSKDKLANVLYAVVVAYQADCSLDEINTIAKHNIVLSRN